MTSDSSRPKTNGRPKRPDWPNGQTSNETTSPERDIPDLSTEGIIPSFSEGTIPALALNLSDVGHEKNLAANDPEEFRRRISSLCNDACARFGCQPIERIYVGSYFCDRFFLSLNRPFYECIMAFCREYSLGLTLVVPVFGQSTLKAGRKRLETLLTLQDEYGFLIDEAVANDPAMALYLSEVSDQRATGDKTSAPLRLSLGRMMAKSPRDPRYSVMEESAQPFALDATNATSLVNRFGYELAECDPTTPLVDAAPLRGVLPLALHLPHCFMTTGHICHPASTNRPLEQKFRADAPCHQECLSGVQVYEHRNQDDDRPLWLTRLGRTIFFENPGCVIKGQEPARIIWTPADFICGTPNFVEEYQTFWNAGTRNGGTTWE